jgi:DNA (cytosine-5)-methyltransferase 1
MKHTERLSTGGAVVAGFKPNQGSAAQGIGSVRRLTPRECERLQGFPDDYTLIASQSRPRLGVMQPPTPDAPRYKALGNSMAVPCMRWIGERIQMVTELTPAPQDRSKPMDTTGQPSAKGAGRG